MGVASMLTYNFENFEGKIDNKPNASVPWIYRIDHITIRPSDLLTLSLIIRIVSAEQDFPLKTHYNYSYVNPNNLTATTIGLFNKIVFYLAEQHKSLQELSLVVSALDTAVGQFKKHPAGFSGLYHMKPKSIAIDNLIHVMKTISFKNENKSSILEILKFADELFDALNTTIDENEVYNKTRELMRRWFSFDFSMRHLRQEIKERFPTLADVSQIQQLEESVENLRTTVQYYKNWFGDKRYTALVKYGADKGPRTMGIAKNFEKMLTAF